MTAGFSIAAQTAQPQAGAATGALQGAGLFGKANAADPMAGFEALLAAFFGGQGAGPDAQALAALTKSTGATPDAMKAALAQALGDKAGEAQGAATTDLEPKTDANAAQDGAVDPSIAALVALLAAQAPAAAQAQAPAQAAQPQDGALQQDAVLADGNGATKANGAQALVTDLAAADLPGAEDAAPDAEIFTPAPAAAAPTAAEIAGRTAQPVQTAQAQAPAQAPPAPAKAEVPPQPQPLQAQPPAAATDEVAPATELATETAALEAAPVTPERPLAKPARTEVARKEPTQAGARSVQAQAPAATDAAQPATAIAPVSGDKPAEGETVEAVETAAARDEAPLKADSPDGAPQQAAPTVAQADQARAAGPATTPVRGSPETVAALSAQIIKKLEGRSTRFDVELNPADLGRVDVRIEIGAHGRMTATMSFENPQAAAELRSRADELQKSLEQAGFDLSGGLQFDVANDQRQASQGQPDQSAGANSGRGRAFQAALDTADDSASAALSSALAYRSRPATGVDIRI